MRAPGWSAAVAAAIPLLAGASEVSLPGTNYHSLTCLFAIARCKISALDPFGLRFCGASALMTAGGAPWSRLYECAELATAEDCAAERPDECVWMANPSGHQAQFGPGSCIPTELDISFASLGMSTWLNGLGTFGLARDAVIPHESAIAACWRKTAEGEAACNAAVDGAGNPCTWCGGIRLNHFNFLDTHLDPEYPSGNRFAWCLSEQWMPAPFRICPYLQRLATTCDRTIWNVDSDDAPDATGAPTLHPSVVGEDATPAPTASTTATTTTTAAPGSGDDQDGGGDDGGDAPVDGGEVPDEGGDAPDDGGDGGNDAGSGGGGEGGHTGASAPAFARALAALAAAAAVIVH